MKKTLLNTTKDISIEDKYKKKTLHQHILDLPDTYIGSVENDIIKNLYVYDENENRIIKKDQYIVLGLYKIFDEILVNAADNTVRDPKCNLIKVNINEESGLLEVINNGNSIPIDIHKEYNIYIPELIFGNLLTSGNYDQKGKTVGGKNGIGSKVANIYSTRFDIEIVNSAQKKKYFQRFTNNMFDKEEPIITSVEKNVESYIKISFLPDYKRFGLKNLTSDMISLLKRRVYDIAGTTNNNVKVYLNDKFIKATTDVQNLKVERDKMKNRIIRIKNRKGKVDLG
jgi:DNA topoisomerase-2